MDILSIAAAKKYTDDSLDGVGALAGKPCVVKSVDNTVAGQHTITLGWTSDSGVESETSFTVYDGDTGATGAQGPAGADGAPGQDGEDGTTYVPEIGTVTTLDAGSPATASVTTDATTGKATFDFGIPKGQDGTGSQVQSDWTQTDDTAVDYIKHKPTIPDPITDEKTGTSINLTDAADARVQDVVVKGRTESGSSVGDAGWGVLDLGTLTWEYTYGRFQTLSPSFIANFPAAVSQGADGLCSHYVTYKGYSSSMGDKKITISNANFVESYSSIVIKDSAYTDAATFKNAMSGALLYYPLTDATGATPTLGITSKNDVGQGTAATITTGLPLRSNGDVYDELDGDAGVIIKRIDTDGTVLVTPTTVSLTATEKAALANLRTFEGTTYISTTDSPSMTATYILNNDNGKALARVQNDADEQIAGKADKVQGKGLSTNDYTNADKALVAGSPISASDVGTSFALTDAADARVQDLKIYGSEDGVGASGLTVTAAGKNMLCFDSGLSADTKNGVTFEPRDDGGIYVHGAASANVTYVFAGGDNRQYTDAAMSNFDGCVLSVSGIPENIRHDFLVQLEVRGDPWTGIVSTYNRDSNDITYDAVTENLPKYIYVKVRSGTTVDNVIYPMIHPAGTSTEYVPFERSGISISSGLPLRRKMVSVDLGSLDWKYKTDAVTYPGQGTYSRFETVEAVNDLFDPTRNSTEKIDTEIDTWFDTYREKSCTCSSRYTVSRSAGGYEPISDKTIIITPQGVIYAVDSEYTDPAAFKAAVAGITLTYPSYCDEIDLAAGTYTKRIDNDGETVLANPVASPLTAAELTAWRQFRTFEGVANISATDDPQMKVTYILNSDNGKAVARASDSLTARIKSVTYTGTGTTSQSITFPDRPFMIMGFTQDPIESQYTRGLIPFVFANSNAQLCMCWSGGHATEASYMDYSNLRVTINGNTMSWTGPDVSQALNQLGVTYTIYYI